MLCEAQRTCCFTGHRVIPSSECFELEQRLHAAISKLIDEGYLSFAAGGALGFDTMAAQAVLDMKKLHPEIKLILVLPCLSQTRGWSEQDKCNYETIKRQADEVIYTAQDYFPGCMHKRNRHLVNNSSACICYLTSDKGGTAYTVAYAKRNGIRIINIAVFMVN